MLAGGWGRWGQLISIVRYPYLKATGKGAFHQDFDYHWWDFLGGALLLLGLTGLLLLLRVDRLFLALGMGISGVAIAFLTGLWFHWRFGGHTGDTLGAVVEWTEALFLCLFVTLH
jgi:adenosylcobinamide-GDP ribazoletransferase